jgi:hypothetical protein
MLRLVLSSVLLVALPCSAAALAAPDRSVQEQSARFALQIRLTGSGGLITLAGTGQIDGARHLSTYDFTANGKHFAAVIAGASPQLTVFLKGETLQSLPNGAVWAREDGATSGPLLDPSVALRLGSRLGPALGTARSGGVTMTKHAIRVGLPDAALLSPMQSEKELREGLPAIVWVDSAGNVRRLQLVITRGTSRFDIDEQLSAFGSPARVTRPPARFVFDQRLNAAAEPIREALPDIETYNADNSSGGKQDPAPNLTGYAGMTVAYLRQHYDLALPDVKIVRATTSSYCVQATVNGITVKKDGPSAMIVAGTC